MPGSEDAVLGKRILEQHAAAERVAHEVFAADLFKRQLDGSLRHFARHDDDAVDIGEDQVAGAHAHAAADNRAVVIRDKAASLRIQRIAARCKELELAESSLICVISRSAPPYFQYAPSRLR